MSDGSESRRIAPKRHPSHFPTLLIKKEPKNNIGAPLSPTAHEPDMPQKYDSASLNPILPGQADLVAAQVKTYINRTTQVLAARDSEGELPVDVTRNIEALTDTIRILLMSADYPKLNIVAKYPTLRPLRMKETQLPGATPFKPSKSNRSKKQTKPENEDSTDADSTDNKKVRESYVKRCLVQISGEVQTKECGNWGNENGKFTGCVVVKGMEFVANFKDACGACLFQDHPKKCSLSPEWEGIASNK